MSIKSQFEYDLDRILGWPRLDRISLQNGKKEQNVFLIFFEKNAFLLNQSLLLNIFEAFGADCIFKFLCSGKFLILIFISY